MYNYFLRKNMRPKSVVLQSWKKLQVLEIFFFEKKKNSSSLFVQIWSSKRCVEIFFFESWDIWISVILRFWKNAFHNKIIDKTRSTKNQENSAHRFVDNYLTNHHATFLSDTIKPWRVGALRIYTGYHFFKRNSLARAL